MITVPSGEARATSIPTHGDRRSSDSPTVGSQIQVSLLADVPGAHGAATSAEWQDVGQASSKPATSEAMSVSGDKDKREDAAGHSQEPKEATVWLALPAPDALHAFKSLQDLVWDRLVQEPRLAWSLQAFPHDALGTVQTPQMVGVLDREQERAPSTPSVEAPPPQNVPAVSPGDANSQLDTQAIEGTPASPKAVHRDTEALPPAKSQVVTEGDLVVHSGALQAQPGPPSPGRRGPPSPVAPTAALRVGPLDHSLYVASEENDYMRSMTSLLNGGEGAISSLADVLVWSDATMGTATALLAFGHSSVTDLLCSTGPSLRSASSILGHISAAISSRLSAGTGWALCSITHMLERVEQRAVENIHSAVSYLTRRLTPGHTGPN